MDIEKDKKIADQTSAQELEIYAQAVQNLADGEVDHVLMNSGNDHAKIIFKNIFRTAKNYVYIAAGDLLNCEVVNNHEYITALRQFLDRKGSRLRVMVSDYDDSKAKQSDFFKTLSQYPGEKVIVQDMHGAKIYASGNQVHFCVADDRIYRLETDVRNRKATCNFKDPDYSSILKRVFEGFCDSENITSVKL